MLLAIDIGNTNITLGVWNGRIWEQKWRLYTNQAKTADEYGVIITSLLRENSLLTKIDRVIMTSVVPVLTQTFTQLAQKYLTLEILNVTSELDLGIAILTDVPSAVGADRLVKRRPLPMRYFPAPASSSTWVRPPNLMLSPLTKNF